MLPPEGILEERVMRFSAACRLDLADDIDTRAIDDESPPPSIAGDGGGEHTLCRSHFEGGGGGFDGGIKLDSMSGGAT